MGKVTPGFDSDIDHIAWDEIRIRVQDGAGGDELHCSEPPTNSRVLPLGQCSVILAHLATCLLGGLFELGCQAWTGSDTCWAFVALSPRDEFRFVLGRGFILAHLAISACANAVCAGGVAGWARAAAPPVASYY